jgi:hypothetical protein
MVHFRRNEFKHSEIAGYSNEAFLDILAGTWLTTFLYYGEIFVFKLKNLKLIIARTYMQCGVRYQHCTYINTFNAAKIS